MAHVRLGVRGLPAAMEGYRILHLSDLHLREDPRKGDRVAAVVEGVGTDLVALTGDYLSRYHPDEPRALAQLDRILALARSRHGAYAVAGNHDSRLIMDFLASRDVGVLGDSSVLISEPDYAYRLVGMRSVCGRGVPDVPRAFRDCGEGEFTILLVHKPDYARLAAGAGVDLYLCGHTHGGQVNLPVIGPLLHNTTAPRERARGAWRVNGMAGHTSPGVGTSFVDVRFRCPPEVTLITLEQSAEQ